jgi:hypothetical protein
MSKGSSDERVRRSFPFYRFWTQREAAAYPQVSERYLRASTCPNQLLRGTGTAGKPIVRYRGILYSCLYASSKRHEPTTVK